MKTFKARILPNGLVATNIGAEVPLIKNHDIYGDAYGTCKITSQHHAIIKSNVLKVGDKLSAGSFVVGYNTYEVREISFTDAPKFPECEVLEEID